MSMYPEGIEVRGKSIRMTFYFKGKRCRETLTGWDAIPSNIKKAGRLRAVIVSEIACGKFNYLERFPNSKNTLQISVQNSHIDCSLNDFIEHFLLIKSVELTESSIIRARSGLKTCAKLLGGERLISNITHADIMSMRLKLLNGSNFSPSPVRRTSNGRSVKTVNTYLTICSSLFKYAYRTEAIHTNPFDGVSRLRTVKTPPNPLEHDEFIRLINHPSIREQDVNLWTVAVYTGLRHGELSALAWEDIDLVKRTITVKRTATQQKRFRVPKTESGERTINLLAPAYEALVRQKACTFLYPSIAVEVESRQKRNHIQEQCTWVFRMASYSAEAKGNISTKAISNMWRKCTKLAGIAYRNPYQTRHTYACWLLNSGANPAFIASQMGHSDMSMVISVYGAWMPSNNESEIAKIERQLNCIAPSAPHRKKTT
ncbi:hypothetical protein BST98_18930 [Photobacterium damselae]|nr:hypothetical protein BST98_18930 [Photobacterium damselae]